LGSQKLWMTSPLRSVMDTARPTGTTNSLAVVICSSG
jgi:hypothetical protein